jgi:homogentisate 1,2-dioxygenase
MPYYQRQGDVAAKRFTELRSEAGALRYETLFSSSGFAGPHSLLYRVRSSTRVSRLETIATDGSHSDDLSAVTNHLIQPARLAAPQDPFHRTTLVRNDDFSFSIGAPVASAEFCRNAWADELWAVVEGEGTLETEFGELAYGPLDLLNIPRGTTWRVRATTTPQHVVVIESRSPMRPPAQYRNSAGQFTSHSIYTERDLRVPLLLDPVELDGEHDLLIKLGDEYQRAVLPSHPFDVVGWDGALYPYALSMRSLEPLSGRVWLTPDVHQVFGCDGLAVCAITPSRTPDHPQRYPGQSDHLADCDEIFYRFAIAGAMVPGAGTITVHSRALVHGPKPGFEHQTLPERTSAWGLILDSTRPLRMTSAALAASDEEYLRAWL